MSANSSEIIRHYRLKKGETKKLFEALKTYQTLESLTLDCSNRAISVSEFKNIMAAIYNCPNLNSFTVSIAIFDEAHMEINNICSITEILKTWKIDVSARNLKINPALDVKLRRDGYFRTEKQVIRFLEMMLIHCLPKKTETPISLNLKLSRMDIVDGSLIEVLMKHPVSLHELDFDHFRYGSIMNYFPTRDNWFRNMSRAINAGSLTKLTLQNCFIDDVDAEFLGIALKRNHSITDLDLSNNYITARGLKAFNVFETNKQIQNLNLLGNCLAKICIQHPANLFERPDFLYSKEEAEESLCAFKDSLIKNESLMKISISPGPVGNLVAYRDQTERYKETLRKIYGICERNNNLKKNWAKICIVLLFLKANDLHAFKYSILPLIPTILEMSDMPEDKELFSSRQELIMFSLPTISIEGKSAKKIKGFMNSISFNARLRELLALRVTKMNEWIQIPTTKTREPDENIPKTFLPWMDLSQRRAIENIRVEDPDNTDGVPNASNCLSNSTIEDVSDSILEDLMSHRRTAACAIL